MKTKYLLIAFVVTALLQASVPLKMIYDSEMTEKHGAIYRFKTAPIDPNDPFRGKYVALAFEADTLATADTTWVHSEEAFATLATDDKGFAKITSVSRSKPDTGDYIGVTVGNYYSGTLHLNLPFERFYMEEGKALEAETGYIDYNQNLKDRKPAYALVAVKDGHSVLKDVIIDGIPIREYVLRQREIKK